MYYEVEQFDPTNLYTGSISLITGACASGKTVLAKKLANNIKKGTTYLDGCLHDKSLECAIEIELENILKNKMQQTLIIDEFVQMLNNPQLRKLITYSKHLKTNVFIVEQTPRIIPSISSQIRYVFMFKQNNIHNKKLVYGNYLSHSGLSFVEFNKLLEAYTIDNNCLVIDRDTSKIYWYNAGSVRHNTILVEKPNASMHRCIARTRLIANELAYRVASRPPSRP